MIEDTKHNLFKKLTYIGLQTAIICQMIPINVYADAQLDVDKSLSQIASQSAMSGVGAKAESDSTTRMFISKAEQEVNPADLDVISMLTDDSWNEIQDIELKISSAEAKTYKEQMIEYFVEFEQNKKLEELREQYPDAVYDDYGKLVVDSYKTAQNLDIRTKSNWTKDDFKLVCKNSEIQSLIDVAIRMEEETGTNALYLVSVAICETGWGKHMAGNYNYFNWSNKGVQSFSSIDDFADYSVDRYANKYTKTSTYGNVDKIIPSVVNKIYAINSDGSINWNWSEHVCSMMAQLSNARQKAVIGEQ